MYMIFLVFDNVSLLNDILTVWKNIGVGGVTILESSGMYRQLLHHVPMRYIFGDLSLDEGNQTLITIVNDYEMVKKCLDTAEHIIGDFNLPRTGIFASWPLAIVKGLEKPDISPNSPRKPS